MKIDLSTIFLVGILVMFMTIGMSACDNFGSPDIRKEQNNDNLTPDYFGWRWDFKW